MGIRFVNAEGRQGTLDVSVLVKQVFGEEAEIIGVKNGVVNVQGPNGKAYAFALGHWAEQNQAQIVFMEGFNTPETALNKPPNGMNYFDQSVFFNDGMDLVSLQKLYPNAQKTQDGRVVVLDQDGLWKTMWAPSLRAPAPPPTHQQEVYENLAQDPRLIMRTAGIMFLLAIAGIDGESGEKGFKVKDLVKAFQIVNRNAPFENKFQIAKVLNQTTGLDQWKFYNGCLAPDELGKWLKQAEKMTTFQYRMMQMSMAEKTVDGMRSMAMKDFQDAMEPLVKLPETKDLRINLATIFVEFVQFLVGLDLLRDISRSTGLNEWLSISEDAAYDPSKMPDMPAFVEAFVRFLRVVMPISQEAKLSFATGKTGLKAIIHIMNMIDECIYSLAGVPDSSAKYKMFMGLKKVQTAIESKLAFHYHPDPTKDKRAVAENPFMQAKEFYTEKREVLYKICQLPRESWNNTLLESLKTHDNLETFYDSLPPKFADMMKSFACMDTAYDMQPWIDVEHAARTHDPFSEFQESFGLTPPEAGYLAKNSPRAVQYIGEAIIQGCGMLIEAFDTSYTVNLLRNPYMLANLIKTLMVASVNRELGVTEVLAKFGMAGDGDPYGSPDPARIWDDPEAVQADNQKQIEEMMGAMAMEAGMAQQQTEQQGAAQDMAGQQMRDGGQPEKAGAGPAGPAMPATKMAG